MVTDPDSGAEDWNPTALSYRTRHEYTLEKTSGNFLSENDFRATVIPQQ